MCRKLGHFIGRRALRVVRHALVDSQLAQQRADVHSRTTESAEQRLYQAPTLIGRHLRGGVSHALLQISRFETSQRWPDHAAQRALRHRLGDLIVMSVCFLVAEIAAHHIAEQATELIEKCHNLGIASASSSAD